MSTTIYKLIYDKELMEYWVTKCFFHKMIGENDWEKQEKAINLVGLSQRRFISEWAPHYVASGKIMNQWQLYPHEYCPFCEKEDDDMTHILH